MQNLAERRAHSILKFEMPDGKVVQELLNHREGFTES